VKLPGSELELARKSGRAETQLDFLAQVRSQGRLIASLRDNIKVKLQGDDVGRLADRRLQYDAGFTLPSGVYSLKFLARENESGKMGTFETRLVIPDIGEQKQYVRMSTVVLSNQREPLNAAVGQAEKDKKLLAKHPLIRDGKKLIPSITRVFRQDQDLLVYFEVYDPGVGPDRLVTGVSARVAFFRGGVKAYETETLRVDQTLESRPGTAPLEFEVPLGELSPGEYICQVSVIDEGGRKFGFSRSKLVLLPPRQPAARQTSD
jgi:hypothetical protein